MNLKNDEKTALRSTSAKIAGSSDGTSETKSCLGSGNGIQRTSGDDHEATTTTRPTTTTFQS